MAKALTLQDRINAISYPHTHEYELSGLIPRKQLVERLAVIEEHFPQFFTGGRLLDVGCNKGFFSLYHQGPVIGIDKDEACIELCRLLTPQHKFFHCSFKDFLTDDKFPRIFIGNGQHYMFIEAEGWGWVNKLAKLSSELVLLEGPIDMSGRDAQRCIPEHLTKLFNLPDLLTAFDGQFRLLKRVPSSLVKRYFLLFERRDDLYTAPPYEYTQYLKTLYRRAARDFYGTVLEVCTRRHDRGFVSPPIIPHTKYLLVDRTHDRPGLNLNAITDNLPECDCLISTAILHHTAPEDINRLFQNLAKNTKDKMILTGPAADRLELFGDHLYHLNIEQLRGIAESVGWGLQYCTRVGLTTPFCELFLLFVRKDK